MGKYKQIFCITKNTFLEERSSKRVIMGFVLGIALFGYWLNNFMQYVWDTGEPINILEAFTAVSYTHLKNRKMQEESDWNSL